MTLAYQKTEVGVIPADWFLSTVGENCDFENGDRGTNYPAPGSFVPSGIPFINAGHIADGQIETRDLNFITRDSFSRLGGGKVKAGDILFCLRGSLGKFGVVRDNFGEGAIASSLVIVRPRRAKVLVDYVASYFGSSLCARMIETWSGGAAQPNLGAQDLAKFKIPLPPTKREQQAISEALSDIDVMLAGLDRLIAKKRDLKQAAMQQLLTGQTRLPGFQGEWEVKRLGQHVSFLKNGVHSRAELTSNGPIKNLHYGDIHASGAVTLGPSLMPSLSNDDARTLDRLTNGDLVFVDASEDLDGVGKSVEIVGATGVQFVAGLHTIAARFDPEVLAHGFKAYLQFCPSFRMHLKRLAAGTKVYATNRGHISSAELPLPNVQEQTAIATVLSDMDAELTALEARRNKTRALKQAMMQELLTGRVRLV